MKNLLILICITVLNVSFVYAETCDEQCTSGFAFFAQFDSDGATRINNCKSNCELQRQMASMQQDQMNRPKEVQKELLRCNNGIEVVDKGAYQIGFCK